MVLLKLACRSDLTMQIKLKYQQFDSIKMYTNSLLHNDNTRKQIMITQDQINENIWFRRNNQFVFTDTKFASWKPCNMAGIGDVYNIMFGGILPN